MVLHPAYRITIAGNTVDTIDEPQASTLIDLVVRLDMDTPADSFTLRLGQVGGLLAPAVGEEAVIELGYQDDGDFTPVMSGTIVTVEPGLETNRVIGHSAAAALLHTFVDRTYENKTAGQIVRDLAPQGGVEVKTADDGITFAAYVVDDRRNVYQHLQDLAALCGFDLYINPDGQLMFKKFVNGETVHVLEYAQHILSLDVRQRSPTYTQVEAWGESPGGNGGEDSWAWLTKDFSGLTGKAGTGDRLQLLERSPLRSGSAAQQAAQAALTAHQRRAIHGTLLTTGHAAIKLGDAIRLQALPQDDLNQAYQVRSVTHQLSKQGGFITRIEFCSIA